MLTKQILEAQPGKLLVKNLSEKLFGIAFVVAVAVVCFFSLVDFFFSKKFKFLVVLFRFEQN